jgi:hypothetical protein
MMDRVKAKIAARRTPGGLTGSRLDGHEPFAVTQLKNAAMDSEQRKELKRQQLIERNKRK